MRLPAAILVSLVLLAGCGGGSRSSSPGAVVRAWSSAIDRGDNEGAASLFAPGARVVQDGVLVLGTHAEAVRWNRTLPCAGHIVALTVHGEQASAIFRLADRGTSPCNAPPGARAAAIFRVSHGKIVLWHQVAPPAPASGRSV